MFDSKANYKTMEVVPKFNKKQFETSPLVKKFTHGSYSPYKLKSNSIKSRNTSKQITDESMIISVNKKGHKKMPSYLQGTASSKKKDINE